MISLSSSELERRWNICWHGIAWHAFVLELLLRTFLFSLLFSAEAFLSVFWFFSLASGSNKNFVFVFVGASFVLRPIAFSGRSSTRADSEHCAERALDISVYHIHVAGGSSVLVASDRGWPQLLVDFSVALEVCAFKVVIFGRR